MQLLRVMQEFQIELKATTDLKHMAWMDSADNQYQRHWCRHCTRRMRKYSVDKYWFRSRNQWLIINVQKFSKFYSKFSDF